MPPKGHYSALLVRKEVLFPCRSHQSVFPQDLFREDRDSDRERKKVCDFRARSRLEARVI